MSNTRQGVHEYKPFKGMIVRTASNHLYLTILRDKYTGLFLNKVLHAPRLKENSLSLRAIDESGLNFVDKKSVLAMAQGRNRLTPKGKLCMRGRLTTCPGAFSLDLLKIPLQRMLL